MMLGRLDILNAFLTQDIFDLQWFYGDITLSQVEDHL